MFRFGLLLFTDFIARFHFLFFPTHFPPLRRAYSVQTELYSDLPRGYLEE